MISFGKKYNLFMDVDPSTLDPELKTAKLYALISVAIGIISFCSAIMPLCGGTVALFGIGFGVLSLRVEKSTTAKVGIALSILGLIIVVVYSLILLTFKN